MLTDALVIGESRFGDFIQQLNDAEIPQNSRLDKDTLTVYFVEDEVETVATFVNGLFVTASTEVEL